MDKYHEPEDAATGFLFRERQPPVSAQVEAWRKIIRCGYWDLDPKGDRIAERQGVPLYDDMVQCAAMALEDAIDFYTLQPDEYAKMVYHGYRMTDQFTWENAITGYYKHLYGVEADAVA